MAVSRPTRFLILVCALMLTSTLLSQAQSRAPLLLVANQGDHTVSLIDIVAGRELATVPTSGITGHEVAVDPVTNTAFVPIYGNSGVGKPGTNGRSIDVIDIATRKRVATIDLGRELRPHLPVYDPHRKLMYVTTELDQSITILDPRTRAIVGTIPTGQPESHMLVLAHNGRRGYLANVGPGTVSVVDLDTRKLLAVIPVAAPTQRISISSDDRTVFTADQANPRLALIDTATNKLRAWVPLPGQGYGTAATPDGRWLLITFLGLNQVGVLDLATLKIVRSFPVGKTPTEILLRPDGQAAYISCGESNAISVLAMEGSPAEWHMASPIAAGHYADGMAWAR